MSELLGVFAELGIALTGFTGIVLALGSGRRLNPMEGFRLTVLLLLAGALTLLAAAPLALAPLVSDGTLWRLASGLMVLTSTAMAVVIARPGRRMARLAPAAFPPWLVAGLVAAHAANAALQLLAAGGLVGPASNFFAPALVGYLVNALVQFGRMLRVPVEPRRTKHRNRAPRNDHEHAHRPRLHTA